MHLLQDTAPVSTTQDAVVEAANRDFDWQAYSPY